MKVTLFTSNKLRHNHLVSELSSVTDNLYCIQECKEDLVGNVSGLQKKSNLTTTYFKNVALAEKSIFSDIKPIHENIAYKKLKMGELSQQKRESLAKFLNSDAYIVFGSSYIKGWLAEFLVSKKAVNIHMGLSPYYRGSGCNFWALYDKKPQYVGATLHRLSKGLDSGDIIAHALPKFNGENSYEFTMKSVIAAQKLVSSFVKSHRINILESYKQRKSQEIRFSKYSDFTNAIIKKFNDMNVNLEEEFSRRELKYPDLVKPFFYK